MNYEILKRRSKRARSKFRTRRTEFAEAKSQKETGFTRWQQELDETNVAQGVLSKAQEAGLEDFKKTESGQILKRFKDKTGVKIGDVVNADAGQLRTFSRNYDTAWKKDNKDAWWDWKDTVGAKGKLDFHFQGGGKQAWGYAPGSADADRRMRQTLRKAGYDRDVNYLYTTKDGGIEYRRKEFLRSSCNPWKETKERRSGDVREHIENRITDRYSKFKDDQEVMGLLRGVKQNKYGRDEHVTGLKDRKGYKEYEKSFASEKKSFDKEKGESDAWERIFNRRKTLFTSAKTEFDAASSDYATARQSQRRFERMGLGDPSNLKSKKFKRGKAGAGSYIA